MGGEETAPPIGEEFIASEATALARERLHRRVVGALPTDRSQAAWELEQEDRVRFSSRPRNRRWKALARHDANVEAAEQRYVRAIDELRRPEEALKAAPDADAQALAGWIEAGERGRRPAPSEPERPRERDAHKLLVAATGRALDDALVRRRDHVERHRDKMLKDARRDLEQATAALADHAQALPGLRQAALACRETAEWVACFPNQVERFGYPMPRTSGLAAPTRARPRDHGDDRLQQGHERARVGRARCSPPGSTR